MKSGQNSDYWSFSIASFTSVVFVVTLKLMVSMRYFTTANFVAIFGLSLGIYYAFMWVLGDMTFSSTYASITLINESPQYFLTIFLCVGITFAVDIFLKVIEFEWFTTPSDFLRKIVSRKLRIEDHKEEFNAIYAKIKNKIL